MRYVRQQSKSTIRWYYFLFVTLVKGIIELLNQDRIINLPAVFLRIQTFFCGVAVCVAILLSPVGAKIARAETVVVTLQDLGEALESNRFEPDAVRRLILEEIQRKFDELELQLTDNELLLQDVVTDQIVEDGCTSTLIRSLTTDVTLAGDTGISIGLESLFDPVELALRVGASVNAIGRAQQIFGFRLGSCVEVASDSFDFSAIGPLDVQLDLSISLNPQWLDEGTLRVVPTVAVTGELFESNITVDVDDSLLRGILESFFQDEVDDLFSADRLQDELTGLQDSLNARLMTELTDGVLDIELPPADDEQIKALYELLTPQSRFPLTAEFLRDNRLEIIAALIFEDDDRIDEILESAALCEIARVLRSDLPVATAYEWRGGSCVSADQTIEGTHFSDAGCTRPFEYYPTSFSEFCATALDSQRLGNAQSNSFELQRWSLSPGTRFDLSALPLEAKNQPYVQRVNYKNAQTDNGNCALEMRVYKVNPNAENLKPLIAFHGGSWQNRGTGFLGVENMATQFVDQGFVVFAPFYRLLHDSDGTAECHNANFDQLLSDVQDSLVWVQQNSESYGASGKPVVFGQSAGGHLAAYLAVQQPLEIERAVLFYAPTDFTDFGGQIIREEYTNEAGIRIMQRVTGLPAGEFDLQSATVIDNTFPAIVAAQPESYPPMYILHGESDSLLPARQSVRMCNGLFGDVENGPVPYDVNTATVARSFNCDDRGSQLHLIAEGEHTLDLCISDELCAAGSPASAAATAEAIEGMLVWAAADSLTGYSNSQPRGGGGSIGLMWIALLISGLFGCRFSRGRWFRAAVNRRSQSLPRY